MKDNNSTQWRKDARAQNEAEAQFIARKIVADRALRKKRMLALKEKITRLTQENEALLKELAAFKSATVFVIPKWAWQETAWSHGSVKLEWLKRIRGIEAARIAAVKSEVEQIILWREAIELASG